MTFVILEVLCLLVSAVGIITIPYMVQNFVTSNLFYLSGILFWSGLVLCYLLFTVRWAALRRKYRAELKTLKFFRNIPFMWIISAAVLLLSVVALVYFLNHQQEMYAASFYAVSFIYLSLNFLFIFSRKTVIITLRKRRKK